MRKIISYCKPLQGSHEAAAPACRAIASSRFEHSRVRSPPISSGTGQVIARNWCGPTLSMRPIFGSRVAPLLLCFVQGVVAHVVPGYAPATSTFEVAGLDEHREAMLKHCRV